MGKDPSFNRFQHRCAEYCASNKKTISVGMANVLSAVAHYLNAKTLQCFPSYDTLANYAGVGRATVIRNIKRLVSAGVITKTQEPLSNGGCKNVYKITFITADFYVKAGYQSNHRSRTLSTSTKTKSVTYNNVGDYNRSITSTPNGCETVVVATKVCDSANRGGNRGSSNNSSTSQKPLTFIPGFKWLANFTYGEDPFKKLYGPNHGKGKCMEVFFSAWWGSNEESIHDPKLRDGIRLTEESINILCSDPIGKALEFVGEKDNPITRKAFELRLKRIGINFFVGELARMWTEKFEGNGSDWRCPAQILLRRMDYIYMLELAIRLGKQGKEYYERNFTAAWEVVTGKRHVDCICDLKSAA